MSPATSAVHAPSTACGRPRSSASGVTLPLAGGRAAIAGVLR
ncbi:hypothetical protein [Paracoccus marcusii]